MQYRRWPFFRGHVLLAHPFGARFVVRTPGRDLYLEDMVTLRRVVTLGYNRGLAAAQECSH